MKKARRYKTKFGWRWRLNGEYHREDGPAIENNNGYKAWYINGKFHRVDGPAIIFLNSLHWYLNGNGYSKEEWFKALTPEQQYNCLWNLNE
jgi:fido (protein-threonine AMPylation protein)